MSAGAVEAMRVSLLGREVVCRVRTSDRARRCRIQVGAAGVTLVRPRRISLRAALALLHDHAAWVLAHLDRTRELRAATATPPGTAMLCGRAVPIRVEVAASRGRVEEDAGGLRVVVPSAGRAAPVLAAWMRALARRTIVAEVVRQAARVGLKPRAVQIRAQRARWGSCSRSGGLSFNWRLIMAPPEVLEYVVIHELAHMLHPNHSRAFWVRVHAWCPDFEVHRRWLRRHGGLLDAPGDDDAA